MKRCARAILLSIFFAPFLFSGHAGQACAAEADCSAKGFVLHGRVKVVESFPDLRVQVVNSFPDIRVKLVNAFPDRCGEWQLVESFPDFTIQYVESFPDIRVQFVNSFPGMQ